MSRLAVFFDAYGFALLLLTVSLFLGLDLALSWRRRREWSVRRATLAGGLLLVAVGSLVLGEEVGAWVAGIALGFLVALVFLLIVTGRWSAPLGWVCLAGLALGVGGLLTRAGPYVLTGAVQVATSIEFLNKEWLLVLALLPLFVVISWRNLGLAELWRTNPGGLTWAGVFLVLLPPYGLWRLWWLLRPMGLRVPNLGRRWVSFGLRCALVVFLGLALADPRVARPHQYLTVLFVVDRSFSIPEEPPRPGKKEDARWERIRTFLNDSVVKRPVGHERDQAGLIVFGRRPRLELLPTDAPRFNLVDISTPVDGNYTDIASALQLALASFPEGAGKRIVLLSDGNENLGNAEEVANLCRLNGVQIDVVPLAADRNRTDDINEALVERVVAPTQIEVGTQVPIKVWVRSFSSRPIVGELTLRQISERTTRLVEDPPPVVVLEPGLNSYSFKQPLGGQQDSYTYEAEFTPKGIARGLDDRGRPLRKPDGSLDLAVEGLPGDRVQNNKATTHVIARGRRRILFLEAKEGAHALFLEKLQAAGESKFRVESRTIDALNGFPDRGTLGTFLSGFDAVVLANIPADLVSKQQQEMLHDNTFEQGCGLVVIGGPESFGAGGWQKTPVEKALPVDCDIKSMEVEGKSGLVLIMHASEMANGNAWQKRIAKLAIERLSPMDEVGVVYYDWNVKWQIPLQPVGEDRDRLYQLIDRLAPGDMPDFDPFLKAAHAALADPNKNLTTRHCIIISDGDPLQNDPNILPKMRADKITVSTVGVATHGQAQDQTLRRIAQATRGRAHFPRNPSELPAIYIRETRLVSQSFVHDKRFTPLKLAGELTVGLPQTLPDLGGFVRTTRKPSDLVFVPIRTPRFADQDFPILAHWQYGLGKGVAYTSDAGNPKNWCNEWARDPIYAKFWEQVLDWSLRPIETRYLTMTTDYREGRIRVIVDAQTDDGAPDTDLEIMVDDKKEQNSIKVSRPRMEEGSARLPRVTIEQTGPGRYEAEFKAEDAGAYFIAFQARRRMKDGDRETVSIRGSITIPYAPEFAEMKSDPDKLKRLAELTGGQVYDDTDAALADAARSGVIFREGVKDLRTPQYVWYWAVFITAVLLLLDVATRRIALERLEIAAEVGKLWAWLRRGEQVPETAPQFLERLKNRKAQVSQTLERPRAERKFEAAEENLPPPPAAAEAPSAPRPQPAAPPPPPVAPAAGADDSDPMARLLKAKKKVWKEREDDKK